MTGDLSETLSAFCGGFVADKNSNGKRQTDLKQKLKLLILDNL